MQSQYRWELYEGRNNSILFERGSNLPTERRLPFREPSFKTLNTLEFQILKDEKSYFWSIFPLPMPIQELEIIFTLNDTESFGVEAKIPKSQKNIPVTRIPDITRHYKNLDERWAYDDIYSVLAIPHDAPRDDINLAFAYKKKLHKGNDEIIRIVTRAYHQVKTDDDRKRLFLQKVIIDDLSKKYKFDKNTECKEKILQHCKDTMPEGFFKLITIPVTDLQKRILEAEKPPPSHIQKIGEKDHISITQDEANQGTKITLTGKFRQEDILEIPIPPGTKNRSITIPKRGEKHECIPELNGDATINVRIIPIDAYKIITGIEKKLKTNLKFGNTEKKREFIGGIRDTTRAHNEKGPANTDIIISEISATIREHSLPIPVTTDQMQENTEISLNSEKESISIVLPSGSKDGDMVHVTGPVFAEVKGIPVDAGLLLDVIKKRLNVDFFGSDRKEILTAIRDEVKRQYNESGLKGIGIRHKVSDEELIKKIIKNKEQYHRSGCSGIDNGKIIDKIIGSFFPTVEIDITMKEAIFGCKKRIPLINSKCRMCGGTGYIEEKVSDRNPAYNALAKMLGDTHGDSTNIERFIRNMGGAPILQDLRWQKKRCNCYSEITVEVPPIKTLFIRHTIPIKRGRIVVKSKIGW